MIQIENLVKNYSGKYITHVLKGVNFTMEQGNFLAIMGKSGCGKTTLLNILGCMDNFDEGSYFFDMTDLSKCNAKEIAKFRNENIGFIFQSFQLIHEMTVIENIELPLGFAGYNKKQMREKAEQALNMVGLFEKKDSYPLELSGGQQQRVAIARAIVNNPKVILADEPTGNLDEESGIQIMELLSKLNKEEDMSIILVTHDKNIAQYADQPFYMKEGLL